MTDLTTRLLAEIERREGQLTRDSTVNAAFHHPEDLIDRRAYLAALRKIVELHGEWHICRTDEDSGKYEKRSRWMGETCSTLNAVADALGVAA